ncbi:hypothetical protein HDU76_004453 [Blyttiomyces sp. JEL0837]|nr:hypothetical protein HDU76_004453 [Blyttiomyces sp. JEL0837]
MDVLEAVRREYRQALADLTFNSRPIITNLTVIAGENTASAPAIVQAIEDQLRNVVPKQKLPVLYLMDSICKNIGSVYVNLFARNLLASFTSAYDAIDAEDKQKFARVVGTWRSMNGRPLFPLPLVTQLENHMNRSGRPGAGAGAGSGAGRGAGGQVNPNVVARPSGSAPAPSRPAQPPRPVGVGQSLHRQLPDGKANLLSGVDGPKIPTVLSQPASIIPVGLPTPFAAIPTPETLSATSPNLILLQQIETHLKTKQQALLLNPNDPAVLQQIPVLVELLQIVKSSELDPATLKTIAQTLSTIMGIQQPAQLPPPSIAPFGTTVNLESLLAPISACGTPPLQFPGLQNLVPLPTQPVDRSSVLGKSDVGITRPNVSLKNEDINKIYPSAFRTVYDARPTQCAQCGARFSGEHSPKLSAHLDWHFRQNRRAKDKARKAISRDWYLPEDDWVNERETDIQEAKAHTFFFESTDSAKAAASAEAEEPVSNIVAEGDQDMPCTICNEKFERYWDEDQEEWMIRNAIKVDGKLN